MYNESSIHMCVCVHTHTLTNNSQKICKLVCLWFVSHHLILQYNLCIYRMQLKKLQLHTHIYKVCIMSLVCVYIYIYTLIVFKMFVN